MGRQEPVYRLVVEFGDQILKIKRSEILRSSGYSMLPVRNWRMTDRADAVNAAIAHEQRSERVRLIGTPMRSERANHREEARETGHSLSLNLNLDPQHKRSISSRVGSLRMTLMPRSMCMPRERCCLTQPAGSQGISLAKSTMFSAPSSITSVSISWHYARTVLGIAIESTDHPSRRLLLSGCLLRHQREPAV